MADSELDRIDPQPLKLKFSTGFEVEVMRLKTRQFFRLLKILTHGAGPALVQMQLNTNNPEEFGQRLVLLIIMAIPDAEQDAIMFLSSMCRPSGAVDKPDSQLTKQERESNAALWDKFSAELNNPDPNDTLDLVEAIIAQESEDIRALGKRMASMIQLARKTGADQEPTEPAPSPEQLNSLPEVSLPPLTSSSTSTDGLTSTSSDSPSAASASASKRPAAASSKSG